MLQIADYMQQKKILVSEKEKRNLQIKCPLATMTQFMKGTLILLWTIRQKLQFTIKKGKIIEHKKKSYRGQKVTAITKED